MELSLLNRQGGVKYNDDIVSQDIAFLIKVKQSSALIGIIIIIFYLYNYPVY